MFLGDFDDFLHSITQEIAEQITNDALMKSKQVGQDSPPGDEAKMGNQIAMIAFTYSVELLGLYHKWLGQQNED